MTKELLIDLNNNVSCFRLGSEKWYSFDREKIPQLLALVTKVGIVGYKKDPQFFTFLLESLPQSVEEIDISGNRLQGGVVQAANILVKNIYIRTVSVADNWLGKNGGIDAAKIFTKSHSLRSIDLSHNALKSGDKEEILSEWRPESGHSNKAKYYQALQEISFFENSIVASEGSHSELGILGLISEFADSSVEVLI